MGQVEMPQTVDLPSGTVTFLFTDIEGSTRIAQHLGDARWQQVLADHQRLLRGAAKSGSGHVYQDQGESFLFVFARAKDAVLAAIHAQRALQAHPWSEGAALGLRMGLHTGEPVNLPGGYAGVDLHRVARVCQAGHGGQILISQTTRDLVEEELPEGANLRDLGDHRLKDLSPQRLFQIVVPDLPGDFPPIRSLDIVPNNLPRQLTSFIGREREIEEIRQLLATTPLLTLTGSGGVGKTRLAVQIAAEMLEEFADGVYLVEFSSISDPTLVPQAVASALKVHEQPGRPIMAALTDSLQLRRACLVLDNCEHVIQQCAELANALLRACPNLHILATSRQALGIDGELTHRVPSLVVADLRRLPSFESLAQYEAIRLFIERAASAAPTFRLTDQNAPAVAQVCGRLDGIPLAIELAAARVKALSVERIAARLDDRFRLLTGGSRTALPRHQTLRGAMDWSYDLLSGQEQALLRRLSVFAGGFTLDAAEAVCGGQGVDGPEVLDLLTNLVDKSLVIAEEHGRDLRYHLLETVRTYGLERLLEAGEEAQGRGKHRGWFLDLAERMEPDLWGPHQAVAFERLETEHDNLRAALGWSATEEGSTAAGLRLAGAMSWFWFVRGYWSEGREWLERLLSRVDGAAISVKAKALSRAAILAWRQGDYTPAATQAEESLVLCRQFDSKLDLAFSLAILGIVALAQWNRDRARPFLHEALASFREAGHQWGIAVTLTALANLAQYQGDSREAARLGEESLILFRRLQDKWGIAQTLSDLAVLARRHGDLEKAVVLVEESLALARELKDKPHIARSLRDLGTIARLRRDFERAASLLEEGLMLSKEVEDKVGMAWSLLQLGLVARGRGDFGRVVPLLEESLLLFREIGSKDGTAWALWHLGIVARFGGDYERAVALFEESLALFREMGSKDGAAWALAGLGNVARVQDDYARAATLQEEALTLFQEIGNTEGTAELSRELGILARDHGDFAQATVLLEQSVALYRALGDRPEVGWSLLALGHVARHQGDYERAARLYEETLMLGRKHQQRFGIAASLWFLGRIARYQQDYAKATALCDESLGLFKDLGDRPGIAGVLQDLAAIDLACGRPDRAARLFGASAALREATRDLIPSSERPEHDRNVAAVRTALGEEAFAAVWAEGQAMTVEQVVDFAFKP